MERARVLVLDTGELDDVCGALADLFIPFIRAAAIPARTSFLSEAEVVIATEATAATARDLALPGPETPTRILVGAPGREPDDELRAGFDFLVRRPLHPEALRLLIQHCVFRGEDRRAEARAAVGLDVAVELDGTLEKATLVDLSTRACRVQLAARIVPGQRLRLILPAGSESAPTPLAVRVLRVEFDERLHRQGVYVAAFEFEDLTVEASDAVDHLLLELGVLIPIGSPDFDPSRERRTPRADFDRKVPAFREAGLQVLLGRDLSIGGVRVEAAPGLELHERVQLALYGAAREEPLIVWASVVRDDGPRGFALTFDPLEGAEKVRLEAILERLPPVASLADAEEAQAEQEEAALLGRLLD